MSAKSYSINQQPDGTYAITDIAPLAVGLTLQEAQAEVDKLLHDGSYNEPLEVIVYVSGGVVQDVDVPNGVKVLVRDYDVEGCDLTEPEIEEDESGNYYVESVWE